MPKTNHKYRYYFVIEINSHNLQLWCDISYIRKYHKPKPHEPLGRNVNHSSENKQFNARATTCARIVTENSAYLLLLKTYEGGGSGDMAAPVSCFLVDNVTSDIYNSKHKIKTASEQIYPEVVLIDRG